MGPSLAHVVPALPPKVSPPRLHEGVVDTRLQRRLEASAKMRMVWLYAGPGAGKTQGVRSWLAQRALDFAWFQVDEHDQDPTRVMYYLQRAVLAWPVDPSQLASFDPNVHRDLHAFVKHWFSQLGTALTKEVVLVLDDLHILGKDILQHSVFSYLIHAQIPRISIVVISRAAPQTQGVARAQDVLTLGPDSLVLDKRQIRSLIVNNGIDPSEVDEQRLEQIAQSSEGWVAAVRLLRLEKRVAGTPITPKDVHYDQLVFRLMQSELVYPLPPKQQRTLCMLAYLSAFSRPMVASLDPSGQTMDTIARYCRENHFVDTLEHTDPPSMRFHPLFREALLLTQTQLTASGIDPKVATNLARMALKEGRYSDALELLARLQDWSGFVELMQYAGLILIERGERQTLKGLLDRLPKSYWGRSDVPARMQILYGAALAVSSAVTALEYLDVALERCAQDADPSLDLALAVCFGVEAVLGAGEHSRRMNPYWDAFSRHGVDGFRRQVPPTLRFRMAVLANVMIVVCQPRHEASQAWALHVQELANQTDFELSEARQVCRMLATLIMLWSSHGYLEKSKLLCPALERIAAQIPGDEARLNTIMAEFSFALCAGRFERAFELFDKGAPKARLVGSWVWQVSMVAMTACLAASLGDHKRMRSTLDFLVYVTDHHGAAGHFNQALVRANLEAHEGKWPECVRELEFVRSMVDRAGHRMMQISSRCALTAAQARTGRLQEAARNCEEAVALADAHGLRVGRWASLAACAYLARAQSDARACADYLRTLLQEMRECDYWTFPTSWVGLFGELLAVALDQDIETAFVRELIVRNGRYPVPRPHPKWPAKYELRTMDGFELVVHGNEGACVDWGPGTGHYELLTTLVWLGGKDVADDALMRLLWPDKSPEHKNPLHQALKRLRQALGGSGAILYDSGRLSLHRGMWRIDVWELTHKAHAIAAHCLEQGGVDAPTREGLAHRMQALRSHCEQGFLAGAARPRALVRAQDKTQASNPALLARAIASASAALEQMR